MANTPKIGLKIPSTADNIAEQINIDTPNNLDIIDTEIDGVKTQINDLDALVGLGGIAESGSNTNGSYIKFEDGTMICFAYLLGFSTITNISEFIAEAIQDTTTNNIRVLEFADQVFPANFVGNVYGGTFGGLSRNGIAVTSHAHIPNNTSWGRLGMTFSGDITNPGMTQYKTIVSLFAIGRWKA